MAGLFALSYLGFKLDEAIRYDGISYEQEMTLIKKEKTTIQELGKGFDIIGGLESSQLKLSFDTDDDVNTTEVVAVPESPWTRTKEENFWKIGEKKKLKDWNIQFYKWFVKEHGFDVPGYSLQYRKVR